VSAPQAAGSTKCDYYDNVIYIKNAILPRVEERGKSVNNPILKYSCLEKTFSLRFPVPCRTGNLKQHIDIVHLKGSFSTQRSLFSGNLDFLPGSMRAGKSRERTSA
jgi:hypothetical protein